MVKGTKKKQPNFLFLAHGNKYEKSYYEVMQKILGQTHGDAGEKVAKQILKEYFIYRYYKKNLTKNFFIIQLWYMSFSKGV